MNLHQELRLRTQHLPDADVVRGIGYTTVEEEVLAHLKAIRESPYLGLEKEYRDARYGERGFLEALCRCLGLDEAETLAAIEGVAARLAEDHAAFRHWLFADTDYERCPSTPIFAMAFTEHYRRPKFPIGFWRLSYQERLAAACQKVRDHMQDSSGRLVTWGDIKRYHYFHDEGESVVISLQGEILGERSGFVPPRATFGLAGSNENLPDLIVKDDE